jgi:hypothetical protein
MTLAASSRRLCWRALACASALGLTLAAAGAARAFTFEDAPANANGAQGYTDLDIPKAPNADTRDSRFSSSGGGTTFRSGNSTFQFGSQSSFDRRYDPSNLFDPFARDGKY